MLPTVASSRPTGAHDDEVFCCCPQAEILGISVSLDEFVQTRDNRVPRGTNAWEAEAREQQVALPSSKL